MKIGDRIFVRGYIDEIRKDTVIIRNAGGYFGTIPSEVITGELPSAQPEIIRCKDCKRQDTDNVFLSMWCYEMRTFVKPNEFCSRAVMRGEQDERFDQQTGGD